MTIYTSSMISGLVGQQQAMFAGQAGYAQQIGFGGPMMHPMMAPRMSAVGAYRQGMGGMYGEQLAMGMGNFAGMAAGVGGSAMGVVGGLTGLPLDPFSAGMGAGMLGFGLAGGGLGGLAVGGVAAGAAAMPFMAAGATARVYGGAFSSGMEQQAQLNSTLRNNFQFYGGQGTFGRGFSQSQMGQIGNMMSGVLRQNPMTSSSELSALVQGGAEMGQFTAVRDVQQFTQRFRQMLSTLRDVQRELGGTLTDALQFVRGSQQAGIFRQADQVNFAAEIRSAEAVTGMDRQQLVALSAQGAQISRSVGGMGRQGAMGALRGAQTLGGAIQAGVLSQEMLSEATGGLTGQDAIQAFTLNMMQRAGRFSRTGAGRFSLFALANEEGTGLDPEMMERFMGGDLTTGQVSQAAHRRVGRMGRARALSREGLLRGAVMEQGGMAGQIGMMRLLVGDRVLDQGDDLASLVMQRRFHMSRPESELMMNLMRNQGRIAEEESLGRMSSRRQGEISRDISENRSLDAFMRHLEHGVSDAAGVTRARELGRTFMTRISSLTERAMNDILGAAGSALSAGDERAIGRMFTGRTTAADEERLALSSGGGAGITAESLFARPLAGQALHAMGLHAPATAGEVLARRGVSGLRGAGAGEAARAAIDRMQSARAGVVTGDSRDALERLEADEDRTMRRITRASLLASGAGDPTRLYQAMGGDADATDAFLSRRGMGGMAGGTPSLGTVARGGRLTGGMVAADVLRLMGAGPAGLMGTAADLFMGGTGGLASVTALQTGEERGASFFGGGNAAFMGDLRRGARGMSARDARRMVSEIEERGGDSERVGRFMRRGDVTSALMIGAVEGTSRESFEAVLGSEQFQSRSRRILAAQGDAGRLSEEIAGLRRESGGIRDEGQRTAAMLIAEQLQAGVRSGGQLSEDLVRQLRSVGHDPAREQEMRDRLGDQARMFRGMQERISAASGTGITGEIAADLFGETADAFGRMEEGREGVRSRAGSAAAAREALASMDPNSEEYRRTVRALMGTTEEQREAGSAFMRGVSFDRERVRALTGRGRRGRAQTAETALGMVTGGSLSEMEFTVGGREVRGARQLMSIIQGGGAGSQEVLSQLQSQLEGMGVSGAESMVQQFGEAARGGFTDEEARSLIRTTEQGESAEDLRRIREQASERQQQQRDPLGYERNQTLGRMETLLGSIRDRLSDRGSLPNGEAS